MKKRIVVILLLLVVLSIGFIPVTQTRAFTINAPFFNVFREFSSSKSWLTWRTELKNITNQALIKIDSTASGFNIKTPALSFAVKQVGLGGFSVTETKGNSVREFGYLLVPDSKTNKTTGTAQSKTNVFGYLWAVVTGQAQKDPGIFELKNYMEDVRQYYGFLVTKKFTPQTLIAVKRGKYLTKDFLSQGPLALTELHKFIAGNSLKQTGPLQVQYVRSENDSVEVMSGFPVDKIVTTDNRVEFMTMPREKILVGYYKGAYSGKIKLYDAMRRYMNDNYIRPMIQPFERFDGDTLPADDSQVVTLQLIVPYM